MAVIKTTEEVEKVDNMEKILVVDDEIKLRKMLCDYLNATGYNTVEAVDGVDAVTKSISEEPDLILMDVMMPGIDGIDALRRIRERSLVPIIMLTAKSEEVDKLMGLELGADDYITKPFSLKELGARVRSQLRRQGYYKQEKVEESHIINLRELMMDRDKMILTKSGNRLQLTAVQFSILELFISNPGRVFKREEILSCIQDDIYEGYERTIDVHIKNIRKIIEDEPSKPTYIETVWGVGYRFNEG